MFHTYVLAPFIVAFLVFFLRFYARENAASMSNPSFLLAALTVIIALVFLGLGVVDLLPAYSTVAFGGVGLALVALAAVRMFMI